MVFLCFGIVADCIEYDDLRGCGRHTGFKAVSTGWGIVICISIVTSLRT